MTQVVRVRVGDVRLTRVPYFDIPLDAEVVGLSAEVVHALAWAAPRWATRDDKVIVGQAVWIVESDGQVIVVDPCGAADDFLRSGSEALEHQDRVFEALADAGIERERVDTVVLTHLDGIGMAAAVDADGRWIAAFPNARVVMTNAELDYLASDPPVSGLVALRALVDRGVVEGVDTPYRLTPEVSLEGTGAHTPGHAVVEVRSDGRRAVLLGHLAVSPLHFETGRCEALHLDPDAALGVLAALVTASVADGAIVIGPLWPFPGAVRVDPDRGVIPVDVLTET